MSVEGWKYYNHAMIPSTMPHEKAKVEHINDGTIWKSQRKVLLARWTSDWDAKRETGWWYVIKDTPFDLSSLKAKRRYEINKGIRNFDVHVISPEEFKEDLYKTQIAAFSAYPSKYRPVVDKDSFLESVSAWETKNIVIYGAFDREDNQLYGYAYLTVYDEYIDFNMLRVYPEKEKAGINAAIVYQIVNDYNNRLDGKFYICDGARSISHETAFQDYLEKYFEFRRAYCKLHVKYNPKYKLFILGLYQFRWIFKKFDSIGIVHKLNGIVKMQEIVDKGK